MAVSKSESGMFSLYDPESEDVQSPVLIELPVAASSSVSARCLMGLEGDWKTPVYVTQSWFQFLVLSWACSHYPVYSCVHS